MSLGAAFPTGRLTTLLRAPAEVWYPLSNRVSLLCSSSPEPGFVTALSWTPARMLERSCSTCSFCYCAQELMSTECVTVWAVFCYIMFTPSVLCALTPTMKAMCTRSCDVLDSHGAARVLLLLRYRSTTRHTI
eukprot:1157309-Pelagomonas_calceolata.AAC.6